MDKLTNNVYQEKEVSLVFETHPEDEDENSERKLIPYIPGEEGTSRGCNMVKNDDQYHVTTNKIKRCTENPLGEKTFYEWPGQNKKKFVIKLKPTGESPYRRHSNLSNILIFCKVQKNNNFFV